MKRCYKCKETKPYEMFSKSIVRKDGHQAKCKACVKAYREANKEKIDEYAKAYREANKEKIDEYFKAYRKANKEKIDEHNKTYYEANKEKIATYREANKEKIAESHKAYREANREKRLEYNKAYNEANKEKKAEINSRRRARKRNAIPKFLRNCQEEKQRLRDIYKLRAVLSVATGIIHHVDHMWPLSDGGPHWSGNLQVITAYDNLSKSTSVCKETKKAIRESLKIARKEYNDNSRNGH
jgi:hypothetical protein